MDTSDYVCQQHAINLVVLVWCAVGTDDDIVKSVDIVHIVKLFTSQCIRRTNLLLSENNLALVNAISICRASEQAKKP